MLTDLIFDALQCFLTERYPGAAVRNFSFVASGWESDVYSFSFTGPSGETRPLIIRLFPGDGAEQKVANEASGLIRLREASYPVPDILLFETSSTALGKPFLIIEKLEGQPLWPMLANASPDETGILLDRFSTLMVELHRLDWRPFCAEPAAYEADPMRILADWFASQRRMIRKFELPGFLAVIDWLESHIPPDGISPAVVHHDFHANNAFLHNTGKMSVIDWTQVGVFDYRADLSWTLLIMGEFGQRQWAERILRNYETQTGKTVEYLAYFDVISYLKQLVGTVNTLRGGMQASGLNPAKAPTIEQEAPLLKLSSQRVTNITGIKISEVERLLI